MPVLKTTRETQEIKLATVEGGVAEVIKSLLGEDVEKIVAAREEKSSPLTPLIILIKQWNLTGEDGTVLPVSLENLRHLKLADVSSIMDAVEGMDDFLGKKKPPAG